MLYFPFCNSAEVCALAPGIAQLLWEYKWLQVWLMHSHDVPCATVPLHWFNNHFPLLMHCQRVSLFLPFLTHHVVQQILMKDKWRRAISSSWQSDCACKEEPECWSSCFHSASCSTACDHIMSLLKLLICAAEALVLHWCGSVELLLLCTTTMSCCGGRWVSCAIILRASPAPCCCRPSSYWLLFDSQLAIAKAADQLKESGMSFWTKDNI